MNNLAIDIETLGTEPKAVVLSIGACFFDPESGMLGPSYYANLHVQQQIDFDRQARYETLKWWMQQSAEAQARVFHGDEPRPLHHFSDFIADVCGDECKPWGNGATFDVSILESLFRDFSLPVPWKFYNIRDVRTIVDVSELDRSAIPFQGVPHDALDDAVHQAKIVCEAWKKLKGGKA